MFVNIKKLPRELTIGVHNLAQILDIEVSSAGILLTAELCKSGLSVERHQEKCTIKYSKRCEFFRALSLLAENCGNEDFCIEESARFKTLTFMADNSRNAVNNIPTLKKLIVHLSVCGYTSLMLYTEDTFEVAGRPYFGHMRGRFTAAEIKELDEYAANFGIELVPCIQTLAHMNAIFKWDAFGAVHDIADILLVGAEETYALIDDMVRSLAQMYRSRTINIGMDEAFLLGKGAYADRNGLRSHAEIMSYHLRRVVDICKKYGFSPMMWSDMFFRNSNSCIEIVDGKVSDEQKSRIPEEVALVHWDYVSEEKQALADTLQKHKLCDRKVIFAGGAWKWSGYMPSNIYSLTVSKNAIEACTEQNISDVIVTAWGDNGGEASLFSIIPVIQQFAEGCYTGDTSLERIATRMKTCFHAELSGFLALDLPNLLPHGNESPGKYYKNPAEYLLFQDVLCGLFDSHVLPDEFNAHFDKAIAEIKRGAKNNPEWKYIFDTVYALAKLLRKKSELGVRIRAAVLSDDRATLEQIAAVTLPSAVRESERLHAAVKAQWEKENKIFGYEVQDIRLAGLTARLRSAQQRLSDYVFGKIDSLPEIEEQRLPYQSCCDLDADIHVNVWRWSDIVTPGTL